MDTQAAIDQSQAEKREEVTENKSNDFQHQFDRLLVVLVVIGLILTIAYGATAQICGPTGQPSCNSPASFAIGALLALSIAMAALAVGTFVGFLFGLPRSLTSSEFREARRQTAGPPAEGARPREAADDLGGGSGTEVNTNLEKISDWLTTIIVGVGLTKLEEIGPALDSFGDRVAPFFGHGGKVFGIAGGLFFLIAGFFLAYVGTRVKLSLVFVWSQRTNRGAAMQTLSAAAVRTSQAAPPVPSAGDLGDTDAVRDADRQLLAKNLTDLKSTDEILAWANAKARAGDFNSAAAAYKNVWGVASLNEKQQLDYATVLAASGDTAGANNVVATMATSGLAPDAQREARQKVAAAAQTGRAADLAARLQQGLYKPAAERAYEDSIVAGEELLAADERKGGPWIPVWLASAYGQRHAALKAKTERSPEEEQQYEQARARVIQLVELALSIDASVKGVLQGLYDPAMRTGGDDDLDSLRPDDRLDALLLERPQTEAPEAEPEV